MPHIDTYRKRAKLLMRWHREGNHSLGGLVRMVRRLRDVTDAAVLDAPFPLALAQEVVAAEAGYADWPALKAASSNAPKTPRTNPGVPIAKAAVPILFVRDVARATAYYSEQLGFTVDFLHGNPPFYGAVSRDGACLHLRLVHEPNFAELAAREAGLILATIEVSNVWALYEELRGRGADIPYPLIKEAWGGTNFFVRDPDGNVFSFVTYSG